MRRELNNNEYFFETEHDNESITLDMVKDAVKAIETLKGKIESIEFFGSFSEGYGKGTYKVELIKSNKNFKMFNSKQWIKQPIDGAEIKMVIIKF